MILPYPMGYPRKGKHKGNISKKCDYNGSQVTGIKDNTTFFELSLRQVFELSPLDIFDIHLYIQESIADSSNLLNFRGDFEDLKKRIFLYL